MSSPIDDLCDRLNTYPQRVGPKPKDIKMQGFKDFLMRGNLVELAVAFVIGASFATVVESFTALLMDLVGKVYDTPDFSSWQPGGVGVGPFLTALLAFAILATVVYFGVVLPYTKAQKRFSKQEKEAAPTVTKSEELLEEIRDAIVAGRNV